MAPSIRRLAVLLGIMKAGGGYVPLDPALPDERLAYMVEDTAMPVIVADASGEPGLPETSRATGAVSTGSGRRSRALDGGDPGFRGGGRRMSRM